MLAIDPILIMGTVLPGLEDIASSEIRAKLPWVKITAVSRGKIWLDGIDNAEILDELRTFDNFYVQLWEGTVGLHKADLQKLRASMSDINVGAVCRLNITLPRHPSIFVNASRTGRHTYSRFEAAQAAAEGILERNPRWNMGTETAHNLEFRLDIDDAGAYMFYRLTDAAFRYRGERTFSKAALRPTVAHALIWDLGISEHDVFVDPFCGSGSIAAEAASYRCSKIIAGDISPAAVKAASDNLAKYGNVEIHQWDARHLPVPDGAIDCVATNLPFGKQILAPDEIWELYMEFMTELKRVLRSGGRSVMLTDQRDQLVGAARHAGLKIGVGPQISLKGLHPWIFRVQK